MIKNYKLKITFRHIQRQQIRCGQSILLSKNFIDYTKELFVFLPKDY